MIVEVTGDKVRALLEADGFLPDQIKIADTCYAVPAESAVAEFGKRFGSFLWSNGLDTWVSESWDCDDFAFAAKTFSSIDNALWRKTTGNECALGFGIAAVVSDGTPHVLNVALASPKVLDFKLRYFEPQMQGSQNVCMQPVSRDSFSLCLWCYF